MPYRLPAQHLPKVTLGTTRFPQHEKVKAFHFLAGPRCFAKKFQTGVHARVVRETAYRDPPCKICPPVLRFKGPNYGLKRHAMKGVSRLVNERWSIFHEGILPAPLRMMRPLHVFVTRT